MIAVSPEKSSALTLANDLYDKWKAEEVWILRFETEDLKMRAVYDQVNDKYDLAYPKLEEARATYAEWQGKIDKMINDEKKLSQLGAMIDAQIVKLRALRDEFTPEIFGAMHFLHTDAGREMEAYYNQLKATVAELEGRLERIGAISKRALYEIGKITKHPHARLAQTIENIKSGYTAASLASYVCDRAVRNVTDLYATVVGAASAPKPPPNERKTE